MQTIDSGLDTLQTRRQEALERLARQYPHYVAQRDEITGGWVVRNVNIPGRVEIVIVGLYGIFSVRRLRVYWLGNSN